MVQSQRRAWIERKAAALRIISFAAPTNSPIYSGGVLSVIESIPCVILRRVPQQVLRMLEARQAGQFASGCSCIPLELSSNVPAASTQ